MVKILTGKKGSGKTKKLIELATAALRNSNGNVVVVETGSQMTYDIPMQARLVDASDYGVKGAPMALGFFSGLCAGNYDITDILVDGTLRLVEMADLADFVANLNKLSEESNTTIVLSVSADPDELPEAVKAAALQ
ncbi:MAG: hypothetical protein IKU17_03430 [Clostridia bacterium]|nr:hypothetical protein [Clostridia bacterium]